MKNKSIECLFMNAHSIILSGQKLNVTKMSVN